MEKQIERIRKTDEGLLVQFLGSTRFVRFPWWWLRDHGEDPANRDPDSFQRKYDTFSIDPRIRPTAAALHRSRTKLGIKWEDGTPTLHTAAQLSQVAHERIRVRPPSATRLQRPPSRSGVTLWSTPAPDEALEAFDYVAVIRGGPVTERWARHLWRWGFALIDRMPPGRAPVREVAAHLGYVRETIFGGVWELAVDVTEHQDSAYGSNFLAPHTDGIYSHDGPGLQLFACQERTGSGGDSILLDGFAVAARLFDAYPHIVDTLARTPVKGHYVEPGVSLTATRPALRFDDLGHLLQISANNYDRAPFLLRPETAAVEFRDAWKVLHTMLNDRSSWTQIPWKPGQTLVFDNWRVLHGRTAFEGKRRFFGCYTNHEDFASKLRTYGVLD